MRKRKSIYKVNTSVDISERPPNVLRSPNCKKLCERNRDLHIEEIEYLSDHSSVEEITRNGEHEISISDDTCEIEVIDLYQTGNSRNGLSQCSTRSYPNFQLSEMKSDILNNEDRLEISVDNSSITVANLSNDTVSNGNVSDSESSMRYVDNFPFSKVLKSSIQKVYHYAYNKKYHKQYFIKGDRVYYTKTSKNSIEDYNEGYKNSVSVGIQTDELFDCNKESFHQEVVIENLLSKLLCSICFRPYKRTSSMTVIQSFIDSFHDDLVFDDILQLESIIVFANSAIDQLKNQFRSNRVSLSKNVLDSIKMDMVQACTDKMMVHSPCNNHLSKVLKYKMNHIITNNDEYAEEIVVGPCGHMYCKSCSVKLSELGVDALRCPICKNNIKKDGLYPLFL